MSFVRAIHFKTAEEFRDSKLPGSFHVDFSRGGAGDPVAFWFYCPCGCEPVRRITMGIKCKPEVSPSWHWNRSLSEPTLDPSVHNLDCGWHGWLRDGYWEAC